MTFYKYNSLDNNHVYQKYKNFGADITAVVGNAASVVKSALYQNLNTTTRLYFQLHNLAGALSGGEVPFDVVSLEANQSVELDSVHFGKDGTAFSTGVVFALSTTLGTYTAAGSADCNVFIEWDLRV